MTARNQLEVPVPYGIAECNGGILRRGNQLRLIVISKGKQQDATLASSGVKIPVNVKMSAYMGSSIIQSRSWHEYSGSNEPEQWRPWSASPVCSPLGCHGYINLHNMTMGHCYTRTWEESRTVWFHGECGISVDDWISGDFFVYSEKQMNAPSKIHFQDVTWLWTKHNLNYILGK